MANLKYNKGRTFEYKVRKELEKRDYFVVRSAGSHTIVDLVAFSKNKNNEFPVLLVQCKSGENKLSKKEIKEIEELELEISGCFLLATEAKKRIAFTPIIIFDA